MFDSVDVICFWGTSASLPSNIEIVDRIRDTVFQNEIYKGRNIGAATIFFDDLRIATNVLTAEGKRAIGTRVSQEVKEHVLGKGKKWTAPAFVVSDWYITAYEPIEDIFNRRVGMLYVGVLEEKYVDIRWQALSVLLIITVAGMLGELGSFKNYQNAKQLIKMAGSNPTEAESGGKRSQRTPMSKKGRPGLRYCGWIGVIPLLRHNMEFRAWARRLKERPVHAHPLKPREIIGAAVNKLLRLSFALVKKKAFYQMPKLAEVAG